MNKNVDPKKLEAKFPQFVAKYVVPEVQHDMGVSLAEAQKSVNTFIFSLQPLTDIHLILAIQNMNWSLMAILNTFIFFQRWQYLFYYLPV